MGRGNMTQDKDAYVEQEAREFLSSNESVEVVEESAAPIYEAGAIPDTQLDATRLYLSEIGFSPLLSAEEEVHYARMAQRGEEAGRKRRLPGAISIEDWRCWT